MIPVDPGSNPGRLIKIFPAEKFFRFSTSTPMAQPTLRLPFRRTLLCSQATNSTGSHCYPNTRYALDFTAEGKKSFLVVASAPGRVRVWKCCHHHSGRCHCGLGFGNQVRIHHGDYFTFYAHLSKIVVKAGQQVKGGEVIGLAGKTGLAGDVHLHWTLGKEATGKRIKNFIPFYSIKAVKVELRQGKRKKKVSTGHFKKGKKYTSTQTNI